jgi:hypothetical protein
MNKYFIKIQLIQKNQQGFAMPMILGLMMLISLVGVSIIQTSVQTSGSAVRHSQVQIAHIASKAAIDYAEEQYELNSGYNGTPEQDLFSNSSYRATIEVVILYNEGSSAKRVQGIGRVYIPELSINAKVVRDIKSTIIRNGEVIYTAGQTDPATFNPILWLDANEPSSLYESPTSNTQNIASLYGSSNRDVVEERGSDASSNPGQLTYTGDDLEMARDSGTTGNQVIGLRFRGLNTPNSATIDNAYIQFRTDETKSAGYVELTARAVASDNPGQWNGNYGVSSPTKTTAFTTWIPPNWNTVGQSGANERLDVTSIVQEIVNRPGWNPGNAIAFSVTWVTGSGIRTAEKGENGGNPNLFVQWTSGSTGVATNDGDAIDQWYDKSGNNRTASFVYGTRPIFKLNQINGLNAVRFSANGALSSTFANITGTELTAFMVMLPRTSSATNARFLSLMNSTQSNDNNTTNGLIPFMKNSTSTTIKQLYNSNDGRTLSSAIDGDWATYSSKMSSSGQELLAKDSTNDSQGSEFSPNYNINQIYIGGRRSTSSGADYANMDVAEVIVYNRNFLCSEIQQIENYLEAKYAFSYGEKSPCP